MTTTGSIRIASANRKHAGTAASGCAERTPSKSKKAPQPEEGHITKSDYTPIVELNKSINILSTTRQPVGRRMPTNITAASGALTEYSTSILNTTTAAPS